MTLERREEWHIHFARLGSFSNFDITCEKDLDPEKVEWPDNAYAFRMHRRRYIKEDGILYIGPDEAVGPWYYHPDSRIETIEEIKKNKDVEKELINQMERNNWFYVIWHRFGDFIILDKEDVAVILNGNKVIRKE